MMRRILLLCLSGLLAGIASLPALAYPPCGPYNRPNDDGTQFCRPAYMISNETVTIVNTVPFAWLRDMPSSTARSVATVLPGVPLRMIAANNASPKSYWDGTQWWWMVQIISSETNGWVEQASLTYLIVSTPTPPTPPTEDTSIKHLATWLAPAQAQLEPGLSSAWLRAFPTSGHIVATIRAGQTFTLLNNPAPSFDSYQWWWDVEYNTPQGKKTGWIEQGSVALVSNPTPPTESPSTPVPTAQPTEDTSITRLATWSAPTQAQLEPGLPYAWVRGDLYNFAVVGTIRAGESFTLLFTPAPAFDGYQWWWAVEYNTPQGKKTGWIEQGSVIPN